MIIKLIKKYLENRKKIKDAEIEEKYQRRLTSNKLLIEWVENYNPKISYAIYEEYKVRKIEMEHMQNNPSDSEYKESMAFIQDLSELIVLGEKNRMF